MSQNIQRHAAAQILPALLNMSLKLTTIRQSSRVLDFSRINIADRYQCEGSSFTTLTKIVEDVTDRAMDCPNEWAVHCCPLDKLYGDAQHTIQAITEVIVVWCQAIIGLVADESNRKWKNEMIRKVDEAGGKILLQIKVSRSPLQEQERERNR